MTRKTIMHPSGLKKLNGAWDVFSNEPNDTADSLGLYDSSECEYAVKFGKEHPELRYIGSEDNEHSYPNCPPEDIP